VGESLQGRDGKSRPKAEAQKRNPRPCEQDREESMKHEEKSMRDRAGGLKIRVGKLNSRTRLAGSRATAKSEIHERGPSPAERENQAGKEGISAPKWTTARHKFHGGKN
jgi:hypothetical protein